MRFVCLFIAAAVVLVGCDKKKETASVSDKPVSATPNQFAPKGAFDVTKAAVPKDPKEILASVNETTLTRADAEAEAEIRIAGASRGQIPLEQMGFMKEQMLSQVVQTFVEKTVLLQEADKLNVKLSQEEQDKAMKEIQAGLPDGVTIDDVMKKSPIGEARMKAELANGLRINKLLSNICSNDSVVSEKELDEFIAANKEKLALPEHVKVRHIQVSVPEGTDEKAKADLKKKAEDIRKKLTDGADFAETAKKDSDCPSKKQGGELGMFARGQVKSKAIEDAAFSQKVNEIGTVVESQLGYHIIQVTEHNQAGQAPRDKVAETLKMQKQKKAVMEHIEALKKAAKITISKSVPTEDMGQMMMPGMDMDMDAE